MSYYGVAEKASKYTRRKCFLSYHTEDKAEVERFISTFDDEANLFIAQVVIEDDDFVDSHDADYVMRVIREKYLSNTTVTIVLMGKCTWSRRYIDWEIASTLRNDVNNKRSGLLGIKLPSNGDANPKLPDRFADNYAQDQSLYAKYIYYPSSAKALADAIEDAYSRRDTHAGKINNSRALRKRSAVC